MEGHGYSFCDDSASIARTSDGFWSGVRHDLQVRLSDQLWMS